MTETAFNPCDPNTWPMTLTAEQVAAIYQRKLGGLARAVSDRTFVPAPFETRPSYRWRKVDVLRHVEGARGASLKRVG